MHKLIGITALLLFAVIQPQALAAPKPGKVIKPVKGFVSQGGLTWMPINSSQENWSDANAYCTHTDINGQTGWRLPTKNELKALYDSGAMNGQGWTLSFTWSSTPGSSGKHYGAILSYFVGISDGEGDVMQYNDTNEVYVSCVR